MTKGEQAKASFESGCNCAQAVVSCFYEEMGLSKETALLLASPFGGGMSKMREVCGAVSGMLMVLGATNGYLPSADEAQHMSEKTRVYQTGQALAKQFEEEFGSIICRDLLLEEGADTHFQPAQRTQAYYARRPCARYIAFAAEVTERFLKSKSETAQAL